MRGIAKAAGVALVVAGALAFLVGQRLPAWGVTYCNLTEIGIADLSNAVQITVKGDGVLDYWVGAPAGQKVTRREYHFTNARSSLGYFIPVNIYPVSFVQMSIPPEAQEGIGVDVAIVLSEPTTFSSTRSPDQLSMVVTVRKPFTWQKGPEAAVQPSEEGKAEPALNVEMTDGMLSASATKADIHQLLAEAAEKAGVNIIVDDSVNHKVSLNLSAVTIDEFLRAVASCCGLALSKTNGMYVITEGVPSDLATYVQGHTESFRLKNLKASAAGALLPNFLLPYVKCNDEQNAVVVTAAQDILDKVGRDLAALDQPPPQIMIEALVVELTDTKVGDAGLGLSYQDGRRTSSIDVGEGEISYTTVGQLPRDFQARLTALVESGAARIRAKPRMLTSNGQKASIFIGAQRFIQVKGEVAVTQTADVGVKLEVTPWTGADGEIAVTLMPEVSNVREVDPTTGLPTLSTRRANTTVRVKDVETIIIGGLTLDQENSTVARIPVLSEIPLLGELFKRRTASSADTELLIYLTPHVLSGKEQAARPGEGDTAGTM
jgi:type II secretory pathway component GspD/PulD (secretin)